MEFWMKLIEVLETKNQEARDNLYSNCTHVSGDFWLFEGETFALNDGIKFQLVGEEALQGLGDLSGSEIKKMVVEMYGVDKQNDSFEAALRPAIEYLKGRHPHCSIIVTSLHAELLEGVEVINEQGIDQGE